MKKIKSGCNLIALFCFLSLHLFSQSDNVKREIQLKTPKSIINIVAGDSTKYFDLYYCTWDSLLSIKSVGDTVIYSKINIQIEENLIRNKTVIVWKTEMGEIIQLLELNSNDLLSGEYTYLFKGNLVKGTIKDGYKHGVEYEFDDSFISTSNYCKGNKHGAKIIHYVAGDVHEMYYFENQRSKYEYWYEYKGEILNLFSNWNPEILKQGMNKLIDNELNRIILFNMGDDSKIDSVVVITGDNQVLFSPR